MVRFILEQVLNLTAGLLNIFKSEVSQDKALVEFSEALQASLVLGRKALGGQPILREDVAAVRKEFNEALDALEPLLPP